MLNSHRILSNISIISFVLLIALISGCSEEESGPAGPAIPNATVKGKVKNAQNNNPISGVEVAADDGNSAITGANGGYELDLSSGNRTITVTSADFDPSSRNLNVGSNDFIENINFNLNPVLTSNQQLRIVLSWDETPQDLDAHLLTPDVGGHPYHVCYYSKGAVDEAPYAILDVDKWEGYGPETITIHQLEPGTYNYWVHRPSDDAPLADCGAVVAVYGRTGLINEFTVPSSGNNNYWHVFDIDGASGAVQSVNRLVDDNIGVDYSSYITLLRWDDGYGDLDANILTPNIQGQEYRIHSGNMGSDNSIPYVTLNQDHRNGPGPEIITIHRFFGGTYSYYVVNYSESPLTQSNAVVGIYDGSGLFFLGIISAPTSGSGMYWHAFDIDGSTTDMTAINDLSDVNPFESAPALVISPTSLDFGTDQTSLDLTISNSGGGTLDWSISESISWLTLSPSNGQTTTGDDIVSVEVDRGGMSVGEYNGNISVTSNGGNQTVTVSMQVELPQIEYLIYDDGDPDDFRYWPGGDGVFAVRMSPETSGQLLSVKFLTGFESDRLFDVLLYGWTGSEPDGDPSVTLTNASAGSNSWVELDLVDLDITFDGTFVVGYRPQNDSPWLAYDDQSNNRGWTFPSGDTWHSADLTFFIRATVQYQNGMVEEIEPDLRSITSPTSRPTRFNSQTVQNAGSRVP